MKTFAVLTTFALAVSVLISGCSMTDPDPNLNKFANAIGSIADTGDGYGIGSGGSPYVYGPTVWMDSLSHRSDSTAIFWGHYQYNDVLIIQKGQLNYWEDANPVHPDVVTMKKLYQSKSDTIDFRTLPDSIFTNRKEWIYKFSVSMDSLKSNTSYHFCLATDCQDRNGAKELTTCNYFMTK